MIGTELNGRYRVLARLGEGGMGEVWLAEHMHLGRKEALKILHPAVARTPQLVSRFRREARAANRVQHPNIVGVYDFGQLPDGRFFLAMEYAEGEPVSDLLRRIGKLPVPRTLHILAQLAEAIHHAHSLGVIHRDLKPHNLILVQHRGQHDVLKVVDFGVAKIIAPEYDDSVGVTRQGQVYGTPAYMAPELFQGIGTDPRSDIYALGCIAFELVVGETPFVGNVVKLMTAQVNEPPPRPSQRRPGIPAELDELILRCLEKSPDRRYQTGREVAEAVKRVPGYGEDRTPSNKRSYRGLPVLPPVPGAGGFEDVGTDAETAERGGTGQRFDMVTGLAETDAQGPDEARRQWQRALHALAEAMVDSGCSDFQLCIGVTNLNQLDSDLERIIAEQGDLDRQAAAAEQRGREREASLRFAIGELRFERDQALARGETVDGELDYQIEELERRLAEIGADTDRELSAITDRAIGLAATLADKEERLRDLHGSLDRLVEHLWDEIARDPLLEALHDRVRIARDAMLLRELRHGDG